MIFGHLLMENNVNTQSESETAADFEALYLAYKNKYDAAMSELEKLRAIVASIKVNLDEQ